MKPNLLDTIKQLGIDTSHHTIKELAEATGYTTNHVALTLRTHSLPYISERLPRNNTLTKIKNATRPQPTPKTTPKNKPRTNQTQRPTDTILALGNKTKTMTTSEIAQTTGLTYLTTQRILQQHNIKHL